MMPYLAMAAAAPFRTVYDEECEVDSNPPITCAPPDRLVTRRMPLPEIQWRPIKTPEGRLLTGRMEAARARLVDVATEIAAILGGAPEPSDELGPELAMALERLYLANDEWQEAQAEADR